MIEPFLRRYNSDPLLVHEVLYEADIQTVLIGTRTHTPLDSISKDIILSARVLAIPLFRRRESSSGAGSAVMTF